jgi:hypothetical protein
VKRLALSICYLCVGILVSWQAMVRLGRLSGRFSWPLINTQWHDCWDFEHCRVPVIGYIVIAAFMAGPSLLWAAIGIKQAGASVFSQIKAVTLLTLGTALFYFAFFVAIWP